MSQSYEQPLKSSKLQWPQCQEPYCTRIAKLSHTWIKGEMSHDKLALEIIRLTAHIRQASHSSLQHSKTDLNETLSQVDIMADALLAAIDLEAETLPGLREEALDHSLLLQRKKTHSGRQ